MPIDEEREYQIDVPDWVMTCTVNRQADGTWIATLVGDAYGSGEDRTTSSDGPTPRAAVNHATDVAEGWSSFTMAPRGDDDAH